MGWSFESGSSASCVRRRGVLAVPRREKVRVKGVTRDSERGRWAEKARLRDEMGALRRFDRVGVLGGERLFSGVAGAGVGGMTLKSGGWGGSRGFCSGESMTSLGGSGGDPW